MTDLLADLRAACRGKQLQPEGDTISQGVLTWFRGQSAQAPDGTVALAVSDDAKVIINEGDVRAVEKDGEHYSVAVSADAHLLLRIDKLLKATPRHDCGCDDEPSTLEKPAGGAKKTKDTITIGPVEVCTLVCGDIVLAGVRIPVCVPVNCKVENRR